MLFFRLDWRERAWHNRIKCTAHAWHRAARSKLILVARAGIFRILGTHWLGHNYYKFRGYNKKPRENRPMEWLYLLRVRARARVCVSWSRMDLNGAGF